MKRWRTLFIGAVLLSASTAQAAPYWGTFQLDQCTSIGYRQRSAILWGIPLGASWETTCANTPATINGIYYASPSRCVNTGTNMWGEFDVPDSSCTPYWGAFQQDACQRRGVRQYSAVIENVQPDISWETACWSTPASPAGQYFASPARCVNTGLNMWGQWDVTDSGCLPYWGTISAAACKYGTLGVRTFSAILWNIPPGETWEYACSIQPATVNGTYFASPARCVNTSLNMWGEWDLPDTTCNPYWGPFQDEGCVDPVLRKYTSILWNITPGYDWEAACLATPATVAGQYFPRPSHCAGFQAIQLAWFLVNDSTCAPTWGSFRNDGCVSPTQRKYSSILENIPPDYDWLTACRATPATVAGQYFASPTNCVNTVLNMWGEFLVNDSTCSPTWGAFTDKCTQPDVRTYSAVLNGIPFGYSWETACANASATVNGQYFPSPTRCVNTGLNMWGEFDIQDASCSPTWGAFRNDGCVTPTQRKYSSILGNIPYGYSWEIACANASATVNGQYFPSPTHCVNTGLNMWGEFWVNDNTCQPTWGPFADKCTQPGVRTYSATLDGIPFGYDWDAACRATPATVNGQYFATPTRCVNNLGLDMYGEFDLPDAACYPHWGAFQKDDCRDSGKRQYSAVLWDIPFGSSWEAACAATPAKVEGVHFSHPTRCVNEGPGIRMWGQFEVFDPVCSPVTECTDTKLPENAFLKENNDGSVSCDAYCSNRDLHWGQRGACVKGFIRGGPNDGMCLRCIDVGDDFAADGVDCYCKPPLLGFADLHNHQFANEGFGGRAFVGRAFGPIAEALPHCDANHGPGGLGDGLANLLGSVFVYWNQGLGHLVGGYDEFDGWPRWNSTTHQSVYEDWLHRAYQGGLRLMVSLAVNNEDIFGFPLYVSKADGRTGSDMEAVNLQLDEAYAMQDHIDELAGGKGLGWYRIVTTAEEARKVMEQGKLAVVLGVEVDNLFGCYANATCTEAYVRGELDKLHARGVRHVFPIHFKANAFGGAALSHHATAGPARDCKAEGYEHDCSALGLTDTGRFLVTELMRRHMIIDIDHMSALAFNDMMGLAEQYRYPVVSGHTGFIDLSNGEKRHEGNLKAEQVARIRDVGGLLAAIVNQGRVHDINTWRGQNQPVVEHLCGGTSQTWAQAYLYAVEAMQGGPVAIGTDFNGLAGLPGPRFSPPGISAELLEACAGSAIWEKPRQTARVTYPLSVPVASDATSLEPSVIGKKTFDYNLDGLAHVGMLPDFVEDLKVQGLRPEDIEPLYRSAEGYVAMWERAEAAGAAIPTLDAIADLSLGEDAGAQTVNLTGIGGGGPTLSVTALSSNTSLVPHPTVNYASPSPTGSLTVTPAAELSGSATITVTLSAGPGSQQSLSKSFVVTVTAVNDAPGFAKGPDLTVLEDSRVQSTRGWASAISPGPPDESAQTLAFAVSNDNNPLFHIQPVAAAADGTLAFSAAADANGTALVTVTLQDDGGTANGGADTSAPQTFTITVTPVNDAPGFAKGADLAVLEGAGAQTIANWATAISAGPPNEAGQSLTFTASSDNPPLFSAQPALAANGTLTFTPAAGAGGTALVTVTLRDNGGTANGGVDASPPQSFAITVTGVNSAPGFLKGADRTVLEDAGAQTVTGWATAISAGPPDEAGQALTFTATNGNPALFSAQPAVAADGTLTFTAAANANGSAVVTLTLKDGGGTANGGVDTSPPQTFTIAVTAVNDAPGFAKGGNQTVLNSAGAQALAGWATDVNAGPPDEAGQILAFSATNDNTTLFSAQPAVAANGTLTFTPAAGGNGIALVTVALRDSGGTASGGADASPPQTFTIAVTGVNNAPSFVRGADRAVPEDAGAQTAPAWATAISAGPPAESWQTLGFSVANDNPALFAVQPAVAANGTLTFTPGTNANGSALVTVTLQDNGGTAGGGADTSAPQTFTITVTPLNDPPSFLKGADRTVAEDSGAQSFPGWATAISTGPTDESGQSLAFTAASGNSDLFVVQPAVAANGALTFTPATDASGSALVTVTLKDSGGTAGGGVDTSLPQTFTITVTGVNDAPLAIDDAAWSYAGADWLAIPVLANDTAAPDSGETLSVTGVTAPAHGQARVAAGGTEVEYLPDPVHVGADEFTYTIGDGNGGTAVATVRLTIDPANSQPLFDPLGSQRVAEGIRLSFQVLARDPENDEIAYELLAGPPGAAFTPGTRSFTWTPQHAHVRATPWLASFGATDDGVPPAAASPLEVPITVTPALCFDDFSDGTKVGDKDWLEKQGDWTVDRSKRFASSVIQSNLAIAAAPAVTRLATGRIAAKVVLSAATVPNASLVFAYRSKAAVSSYRYVTLLRDQIVIGDSSGVRSPKKQKFMPGTTYLVSADLAADGRVTVSVNGVPRHTFKFLRPLAGQVGVAAERTRSFFDNFTVWSSGMLR